MKPFQLLGALLLMQQIALAEPVPQTQFFNRDELKRSSAANELAEIRNPVDFRQTQPGLRSRNSPQTQRLQSKGGTRVIDLHQTTDNSIL